MDVSGINSGTAGQFDLNVNTELKTPDGEYKYDIGDNSAGAYNFGSSSQALNVQEDKAEKKAYELSKLTGTQILLLIVSESGLIYTFSTPKLQPVISTDEGKALIHRSISGSNDGNSCLDSTEVIKNEYLYCDSTAGPAVKNFSDITSLGLGVARENNNGYSSYTRYVVGNIGTNQYLTTMGNTEDLTLGKRSYQEYQNESNMTHPYHNRSEPQHSMVNNINTLQTHNDNMITLVSDSINSKNSCCNTSNTSNISNLSNISNISNISKISSNSSYIGGSIGNSGGDINDGSGASSHTSHINISGSNSVNAIHQGMHQRNIDTPLHVNTSFSLKSEANGHQVLGNQHGILHVDQTTLEIHGKSNPRSSSAKNTWVQMF